MGLRSTQGDEKRLLSSNRSPWERRPPLCHLDRSVPGFPTSRCWRRPRVRLSVKRAACRSSKPRISTGNPGERSGEICGQRSFLGNVFRRSGSGLHRVATSARSSFLTGRFLPRGSPTFRRSARRLLTNTEAQTPNWLGTHVLITKVPHLKLREATSQVHTFG